MYERTRTRGPRAEIYPVSDIASALNTVATITGDNSVLDAVATAFGLAREKRYGPDIQVFDVRPALTDGR